MLVVVGSLGLICALGVSGAAPVPCPTDPETAVFTELRTEIVKTFNKNNGNDAQRRQDALFLELLDSLDIAHAEIFKNNRDHPDRPMADVLDLRKDLFGR